MTIITSFYTPDWQYPEFARQLTHDCEKLGLEYHIVEKQSNNDYAKNCNIKPFFIKESLEKFKKPILWMDVDGSIVSKPELILNNTILEYDVAANRALNDASKIHVGSIWLNYTKSTMSFIDDWCESVVNGGIDDGQFNSTFRKHEDNIKFYELPPNYFVILKNLDSKPPENSCIVHRISKSSLKHIYSKSLNRNKLKK